MSETETDSNQKQPDQETNISHRRTFSNDDVVYYTILIFKMK
jgi:hypothetical protein